MSTAFITVRTKSTRRSQEQSQIASLPATVTIDVKVDGRAWTVTLNIGPDGGVGVDGPHPRKESKA